MNTLRVLYVGRDPGPVAHLPGYEAGDSTFLVTITPNTDIATTRLTHSEFDCIVYDERLPELDLQTFLHHFSD